MMSPVLTLSPEAVEEDGVFRHPYLVPRDLGRVGDQDWLPLPEFAVCHTPLPANFCTCGRYVLFASDEESEALWSESGTCHATAPSGRTLFALRSARRAGRVSPYSVCSQVTAHPHRSGFLHTARAIT